MQKVLIRGGDGQAPRDHNGTTDFLNALYLPTPPRSTVVKVTGNGVPRAVGEGGVSLLSGLEVPRVNGTGQIRQRFGGWAKRELHSSGRLSSVGGGLKHGIDPLWDSVK